MTKDKLMNSGRMKAHQKYILKSGREVPGASTIAKMLDSGGGLIQWAWNLGKAGIDYRKFRDATAEVGTLAHEKLMAHHRGTTVDISQYLPEINDQSENCLKSYYAWEKNHVIKPVSCEIGYVSETYKFGGTIDLVAEIDGQLELADYKTGKRIYDSHWLQLAGYLLLLEEAGVKVNQARIINIPRSEGDEFVDSYRKDLSKEKAIFIKLCEIYHLQHDKTPQNATK